MKSEKKLQDAIDQVEEAGGIVMMPSDPDLVRVSEEDVQNEIDNREFEERKSQAFKEMDKALGSKNFSYSMADDICYENGIEMDYIEEWIHSQF